MVLAPWWMVNPAWDSGPHCHADLIPSLQEDLKWQGNQGIPTVAQRVNKQLNLCPIWSPAWCELGIATARAQVTDAKAVAQFTDAVWIQALAQELPYAMGTAEKEKERQKEREGGRKEGREKEEIRKPKAPN